ncbi:Rossmann-fold NAD(P)-binding domain-containing protein [Mangrovivirga cuniculi]|uniref:NAD(P)H-binding protein n=1 Tax=Mangrovivirga cuniculi TaxID=2715131 RepID=UPI0015860948|nr:NAD(P)H-binding protein [Mangrovivirga cuniculi]
MKKNSPVVAIAGCGWTGLPLGKKLSIDNYQVKGSVRHDEKITILNNAGITPYLMNLPDEVNKRFFTENDFLVISIPAGTKSGKGKLYLESIREIIKQLKLLSPGLSKVILLSSIGIYPHDEGQWTEDSGFELESDKQNIIRTAEKLIQENFENNLILRLGGLMGYDRYLAKYYLKKDILDIDPTPVNYVHRDDVIDVVIEGIQKDHRGIYNVVAPEHPPKYEVIQNSAHSKSVKLPPSGKKLTPESRTISGKKLMNEWDFGFKYPDPNRFWSN